MNRRHESLLLPMLMPLTRVAATTSHLSAGHPTGTPADVLWRPEPSQTPSAHPIHRIFWMHVPKCGSSFTHTVFHYACRGASWNVGRGTHHPPPGSCGDNISLLQRGMTGGNYHTPVQWIDNRMGDAVGNVVAMFRRPSQRLMSAFAWMKEMPKCCTRDWGMGNMTGPCIGQRAQEPECRRRSAIFHMKDAAAFARTPGALGCQTKMLLGRRCQDDKFYPSREQQERARQFVDKDMAFVGLLEEWERSVCLWHARYGGLLYRAELTNTRPTTSVAAQPTGYNESVLNGIVDPADELIYDAATTRFWRDVRSYAAPVAACQAAVRRATSQPSSQRDSRSHARSQPMQVQNASAAPHRPLRQASVQQSRCSMPPSWRRELQRPRIAFCMSGEVRTFLNPKVHGSLLNDVVIALSSGNVADARVFASLKTGAREESASEANQSQCHMPREDIIMAVLSRFPLGGSELIRDTLDAEQEFLSTLSCRRHQMSNEVEKPRQAVVGQHLGIQRCWQLMVRYEQTHDMRFDFVVRMRPDNVFPPRTFPSLRQLYANAFDNASNGRCESGPPPVLVARAIGPFGTWVRPMLNDMFFVAPRQFAWPPFNGIEFMRTCPGKTMNRPRPEGDCCGGSWHLLKCALGHAGQCGTVRGNVANSSLVLPASFFAHSTVRQSCWKPPEHASPDTDNGGGPKGSTGPGGVQGVQGVKGGPEGKLRRAGVQGGSGVQGFRRGAGGHNEGVQGSRRVQGVQEGSKVLDPPP